MSIQNTLSGLIPIIRGHIKDQANPTGRIAFEYLGDSVFTLPDNFIDEDSIRVYVNNSPLDTADWTFDSLTNQLTIDPIDSSEELSDGDIILITYSFYKTYSDDEIKCYIKSALGYFVRHRYKKTFEVDDDEQIVSINNINPTQNELHFIAMISSILIDPQNIDIDTPEFKLSKNRDESDQKQIERAFVQFKRFIGNITFNNTEPDIC